MSRRGTSIAAFASMPTDFEQVIKDVFGESLNRSELVDIAFAIASLVLLARAG